jgi:hypothetical protein
VVVVVVVDITLSLTEMLVAVDFPLFHMHMETQTNPHNIFVTLVEEQSKN